jgi:hypothetical protein
MKSALRFIGQAFNGAGQVSGKLRKEWENGESGKVKSLFGMHSKGNSLSF